MFNLADSIPQGATITSAKVRLHMSKTNAAAGAVDIKLHKVTAEWGEGTSDAEGNQGNEGSGAPATSGDATWLHRSFNTVLWSTPGGDFSPTVSASLSVAGIGVYEFGSSEQLVSDVQGWLDSASTNYGWIVIGNEATTTTAKRFDTREIVTEAHRPTLIVQYTTTTNVNGGNKTPYQFSLKQNFPNPFNPSTSIQYSLPFESHVSLKVFDILGKEIATLVNERKNSGSFTYQWNASGLPSGIYFCKLQADNNAETKKLILAK